VVDAIARCPDVAARGCRQSHFMRAGDGKPARDCIKGWLDRFFPLHLSQRCRSTIHGP
jgi:hypothetical protein